METHSSILDGKIPWTAKSQTWLSYWAQTHTYTHTCTHTHINALFPWLEGKKPSLGFFFFFTLQFLYKIINNCQPYETSLASKEIQNKATKYHFTSTK